MTAKAVIPFFLDNCVPDSVGKALESAGHSVTRLRAVMPTDSPDAVVATACLEGGQVLVSHDKDFRAVSKRIAMTQRAYHKLHRVDLRCSEPHAARRIADFISVIEAEWNRVLTEPEGQMIIEISDVAIRILR